jgi:hypothetical protein
VRAEESAARVGDEHHPEQGHMFGPTRRVRAKTSQEEAVARFQHLEERKRALEVPIEQLEQEHPSASSSSLLFAPMKDLLETLSVENETFHEEGASEQLQLENGQWCPKALAWEQDRKEMEGLVARGVFQAVDHRPSGVCMVSCRMVRRVASCCRTWLAIVLGQESYSQPHHH